MEQLGVTKEECVPEAAFIDDLGADSLDIVELIMAMEENFGIEITDDELSEGKDCSGCHRLHRKRRGGLTETEGCVITGLGAVSPLGNSVRETWDGICSARSGIGVITSSMRRVL